MMNLNDEVLKEEGIKIEAGEPMQEEYTMPTLGQAQENPLGKIASMLWADTGEGEIEDYINHPFNFKHSKGLAQIIRGLTGILGDFRKAIFDIAFGYLKYKEEEKEVIKND